MSHPILDKLFFKLFDVVILLLGIFHLFLFSLLGVSDFFSENFDLVVVFKHGCFKLFLSCVVLQLLLVFKGVLGELGQLTL